MESRPDEPRPAGLASSIMAIITAILASAAEELVVSHGGARLCGWSIGGSASRWWSRPGASPVSRLARAEAFEYPADPELVAKATDGSWRPVMMREKAIEVGGSSAVR